MLQIRAEQRGIHCKKLDSLVIGLKLLLQGRTENYNDEAGEPYPIELAGEDKAVSSLKIQGYLNDEFFYYYDVYMKHKHLGSAFEGGWSGFPDWYCQLIVHFDNAVESVKAHNEREAYKNMRY